MARGRNLVVLLGNVAADAEVRYTANGGAITTIRLATSESWKDKNTGQKQERTEWHRVKFFGRLAEIAGEYIKKGRQVYIEGSIRQDKYTDKDGVERYSFDIVASELQLLGEGRGASSASVDREEGASSGERATEAGRYQRAQRTAPAASTSARAPATVTEPFDPADDIPF